jgi:hypothetical protein
VVRRPGDMGCAAARAVGASVAGHHGVAVVGVEFMVVGGASMGVGAAEGGGAGLEGPASVAGFGHLRHAGYVGFFG